MKITQLSATWCPPCRSWKKRIEKAIEQGLDIEYEYVQLDTGESTPVSKRWEDIHKSLEETGLSGLDIKGLPTFVVTKEEGMEIVPMSDVGALLLFDKAEEVIHKGEKVSFPMLKRRIMRTKTAPANVTPRRL